MATGQVGGVLQHHRRVHLLRDGAWLPDEQLLRDFISRRDDAALAVLVKRHGPMVWGVCRRLLANYHDAEDAFQATFLVFVRKAASIASKELLANWLYGVSFQTARKLRATASKRRARERQVSQMPEPAVEQMFWNDVLPHLDEELTRLPDKYRAVVVLCELEGKSRREAARQLGVPEGTVASRLATARTMLAKRLARYGLAVSAGALATMLSPNASACVPASVMSATIKAACLTAAGPTAASSVISFKVAALTEGVLKTMFLTKLKATMAGLLLVGILGIPVSGVRYYAMEGNGANQKPGQDATAAAPIQDQDKTERELRLEAEILRLRADLLASRKELQELKRRLALPKAKEDERQYAKYLQALSDAQRNDQAKILKDILDQMAEKTQESERLKIAKGKMDQTAVDFLRAAQSKQLQDQLKERAREQQELLKRLDDQLQKATDEGQRRELLKRLQDELDRVTKELQRKDEKKRLEKEPSRPLLP